MSSEVVINKGECMKHKVLIMSLLVLFAGTAAARTGAENISGTWNFSVNLEGGPQNVPITFVFKQEGEKLTGSQSTGSGEQKVTGTVKGNKVMFSVEGKTRDGESYKNAYVGTIESPTRMSGTVQFIKGPGKWTATRQAKA
jgi:hypothetical protein